MLVQAVKIDGAISDDFPGGSGGHVGGGYSSVNAAFGHLPAVGAQDSEPLWPTENEVAAIPKQPKQCRRENAFGAKSADRNKCDHGTENPADSQNDLNN